MKKIVFRGFQLLFILLIGFALIFSCTDRRAESVSDNSTEIQDLPAESAANPIEGGWYLVWGEYSGNVREDTSAFQFKLFTDTHFAFLMRSTEGQWNSASTGSYRLNGDTYIETFEFSTNPENMGGTAEWNYSVSGDTLWMDGPIKIYDGNGEESPEWSQYYHTMKEIRVRAK